MIDTRHMIIIFVRVFAGKSCIQMTFINYSSRRQQSSLNIITKGNFAFLFFSIFSNFREIKIKHCFIYWFKYYLIFMCLTREQVIDKIHQIIELYHIDVICVASSDLMIQHEALYTIEYYTTASSGQGTFMSWCLLVWSVASLELTVC